MNFYLAEYEARHRQDSMARWVDAGRLAALASRPTPRRRWLRMASDRFQAYRSIAMRHRPRPTPPIRPPVGR
jgi:hypothetical protein